MKQMYMDRIAQVRDLMEKNGWDAVVIGGSDPHSSEYPASRWQQVTWLSGFTGEAGDLVITKDHAGLWTDSRYFIQALDQLEGTSVQLHKTRVPDAVSIPQWLSGRASTVALDGLCQSVSSVKEIEAASCQVVSVPDLLSDLWHGRPDVPISDISTIDMEVSGGLSRLEKVGWLRQWMASKDLDYVLLTSLDEIAWLLNIRGEDIDYNPLVISYLLISQGQIEWFVEREGMSSGVTQKSFEELLSQGVEIFEYSSASEILKSIAALESHLRIFADPSTLNYHIFSNICQANLVLGASPVSLKKAVKTESEIEKLRNTYIEDGVAMECFLYWLETELASGRDVTEWEASEKLTSIRSQRPYYKGNSFENISAYGANAALPHYVTPHTGSAVISSKGLYLVDSGGQYLTGTTDITRTVPVGPCSDLEKEDYTLVLKGMIDLSMAVFPHGTTGHQLDALARMPLWRAHRNFGHGTGHGVGYYLCVHEGPQSIRYQYNPQPLLSGMVTSNEPGIYREGMHGVRHENIVLAVEDGQSEFGKWMRFETLTCCHIETSAILPDILGAEALEWLNDYNTYVFTTLSPLLPKEVAQWLKEKCRRVK